MHGSGDLGSLLHPVQSLRSSAHVTQQNTACLQNALCSMPRQANMQSSGAELGNTVEHVCATCMLLHNPVLCPVLFEL